MSRVYDFVFRLRDGTTTTARGHGNVRDTAQRHAQWRYSKQQGAPSNPIVSVVESRYVPKSER